MKIYPYIKVARPVHWIKNLALFAALIFSGNLLNAGLFWLTVQAFVVFSMAASATYIFNDAMDAEQDRLHPIKKKRPIAKGDIGRKEAFLLSGALAFFALYWAYTHSYVFFLLLASYLILQVAYSFYLKQIYILDILIIATGFIIRVYAGAFVIDAHLSVWFLLCVLSVSLFLASGKRRAELSLIGEPSKTRKSLRRYPPELLNSYVTMFGNAAWMSWSLFTFFESPNISTSLYLILAEVSKATSINKLLMTTIPFSIFAVMRYQALIFEDRTEAPERVLLTDFSLMFSVLVWGVLVVWILYGGGASV